jgi:hypothetical protein
MKKLAFSNDRQWLNLNVDFSEGGAYIRINFEDKKNGKTIEVKKIINENS